MKANVRRLTAGLALGALIAGAALGNSSQAHASGFGDGVLAPPLLDEPPDGRLIGVPVPAGVVV